MNLDNILNEGINWLLKNEELKLFGSIDRSNSIIVTCDTNETSLEEFLEIGKKNGVKLFIIFKSIFNTDEELQAIDIEKIDLLEQKNIKLHLNTLNKFDGQIDILVFSYLINNVVYEFLATADWLTEVDEIKEEIKRLAIGEEVYDLPHLSKRTLSKKKIKELSEALANHDDYFRKRYDPNKIKIILSEVLENEKIKENKLSWIDRREILEEGQKFFESKVLIKREEELIKQIFELKEEGLPKVAIRSKLDLSEGMLNKYYYKE